MEHHFNWRSCNPVLTLVHGLPRKKISQRATHHTLFFLIVRIRSRHSLFLSFLGGRVHRLLPTTQQIINLPPLLCFCLRFQTSQERASPLMKVHARKYTHAFACAQDHGNHKYGAPATHVPKADKSRQGKMEKSFLTFVATYPTWEPGPAGACVYM